MLIVTLPFCRPLARMWIPVEKVRPLAFVLCVQGHLVVSPLVRPYKHILSE